MEEESGLRTPPNTQRDMMESDNQNYQKDGGRQGLFLSPDPDEQMRIQAYHSSFQYQRSDADNCPEDDDDVAMDDRPYSADQLFDLDQIDAHNSGGDKNQTPLNTISSQKAFETKADVESDDDIVSIDEREASRDAQRIWSLEDPFESRIAADNLKVEPASQITAAPVPEHRLTLPVPGIMDAPPQKKVPVGLAPGTHSMISAQQAMRRQMLQKRKHGAASIFGGNPAKIQKSGPNFTPSAALNGNARMRNVDSPKNNGFGDSEDLPSDENELEDSWMMEDEEESQVDELSSLRAARDILKRKQDAREGFLPDDVFKLLKTEEQIKRIERRQGKRKPIQDGKSIHGGRDGDSERESETEDFSERNEPQNDLPFSNDNEVGMAGSKVTNSSKRGKAKKDSKGRVNKNARDVQSSRHQKDLQKLQKKQIKSGVANEKGKKKAAVKQSPKSGKNAQKDSEKQSNTALDPVTKMLMGLTASDQIAERIAHGDVAKAENILTKNKMNQLEQLLEGIPEDYDTHHAKVDRKKLLEASKRFGYGKVKARNGNWLLTGMKSSLLHHQLLAANWMVDRELASSSPYGGLLGDAMGLGKTVEMLATMVGNPPSPQHIANGRKATLIVVPASAVKQWVEEIKKHVDPQVFEGLLQYKASSEIPMVFLQYSDIVITSYQEVMKSLPFPTTPDDKKDAQDMGIEAWIMQHKSNLGYLHKMKWYRIVLDEAHAIKNYKSRTSLACVFLDGIFRWAMTGTPLMNNLDELYPYFKFLRVNWSENIDEFRRRFGDPDTVDTHRRLAVILAIIML